MYNNIIVVIFLVIIFPIYSISADVTKGASRTSGVAPLSVNFNADLLSSTSSEHRFHDLDYEWNFGDTGAGNWGIDGKSKNTQHGPVTAHLYESAGTYTATCTIRDSSGVLNTDTYTITVSSPDSFYSGTNTTCFSDGTDWTGCPSGSAHVTSSNIHDSESHSGANKRVLFHRGSAWNTTSMMNFAGGAGPATIGAYGSCSSPDSQGICSNAPHITLTGGTDKIFDISHTRDWRIMDLHLTGYASASLGFTGWQANYENSLIRIKTDNFQSNIDISRDRFSDNDYDQCGRIMISDCDLGPGLGADGYGLYISGEWLSIFGNKLQGGGQHTLRINGIYASAVEHNLIYGASYGTSYGGQALKLHGLIASAIGTYAQTGNKGSIHEIRYNVVSDNIFGGSGPWPVCIAPQNADGAEWDELLFDMIFEKNKIVADYGSAGPGLVNQALRVSMRYATVRNNIFDMTGSTSLDFRGIVVYKNLTGSPTPVGVSIYNNTFYNPGNMGSFTPVVEAENSTLVVRNNLITFPDASYRTTVYDAGGSTITQSNNIYSDTPYLFDPNNATPLSRDFHLTASSTAAIGAGYAVPVLDDFDGTLRGETFDIGADEYESEEQPAATAFMAGGSCRGCTIH